MGALYGVLGILVVVAGIVLWADQNAVARTEGKSLMKAVQVKEKSLNDIRERSRKAREETKDDITRLRTRSDGTVIVEGSGEFCSPGCEPRWEK